jgi:hypothetical protein
VSSSSLGVKFRKSSSKAHNELPERCPFVYL